MVTSTASSEDGFVDRTDIALEHLHPYPIRTHDIL
jgi:hypothetical protein